MLHLRRADEEDWDDLLEADATCFPHDYRPELLGAAWWVVETDAGELAAYAAARPSNSTPGGAYLCRAGVLPAFRGQRLQRRLVRVREAWARRHGYTSCVTDTYWNPASANTLIACGYKMWTPKEPWSYADACYWIRSLTRVPS